MWATLLEVAGRPSVNIRLYVDHEASLSAVAGTLTPDTLAFALPRARIFASARGDDGRRFRSHAKFVVVDHQIVHLTSANFSFSAEHRNVEFGLRVDNSGLAQLVEQQLRALEGGVYERVEPRRANA